MSSMGRFEKVRAIWPRSSRTGSESPSRSPSTRRTWRAISGKTARSSKRPSVSFAAPLPSRRARRAARARVVIDFHVLNFRAAAVGGGFVEPQVFTYDGQMLDSTWVERLGQSGPLTFLFHGFNVDWNAGWNTTRRFVLLLREL